MRVARLTLAVIVLLGCGPRDVPMPGVDGGTAPAQSALNTGTDPRRVEAEAKPTPRTGPDPAFATLPHALSDCLRADFPEFVLAPEADLSKYPYAESHRTVPSYQAVGDFDGNGLTDQALLLVRGDAWRLVEFLQGANSTYTSSLVVAWDHDDYQHRDLSQSSNFLLQTISKGDHYEVTEGDSGQNVVSDIDSVVLSDVSGYGRVLLYRWNGKSFDEVQPNSND